MTLSEKKLQSTLPVQTQSEQQLFLQKISQLPILMKFIIDKDITISQSIALADAYHLDESQNKAMIFLEGEIVVKNLVPVNVLTFVQQHIISDNVQAKKLAIDFLGTICLPMQWYIGNVEGLIKDLGGDVAKYEAEARKNYPEVYAPDAQKTETETTDKVPEEKMATIVADTIKTPDRGPGEPTILHDIEEKLVTAKGRASILLHLVALSQQIETAGKSGKLNEKEAGELLHGLDALSYAVNTQDLNPLEIGAIKRRLKGILSKVGE